ncbi:MAG TPA: flagellar hook capping FlgD N-terminal domain-containing protein [Steroidobacteraceae bacterium]|nr:flagellar hook capping FlgD N-terminal domain-containing protein [Steroidobacteraceae bacterium]
MSVTTVSDPIAALAAQSQATAASANANTANRLDQKSFLQLMIAQFKNQDPTKPQDPAQFLGQLAQFSTVSGIQDMQTSLSALSDSLRSTNVLNGATLVGHSILAPNDTTALTGTSGISGAIDVPAGATSVQINVRDASGQLVRHFTIPAQQGLTDFSWDGVTDRGDIAAPGTYSFSADANVAGQAQSLQMLLSTRVNSVTIDPTTNGLTLNTVMGPIALADVRRVM